MLPGDVAEPDGSDRMHERERWALRGFERILKPDPMCHGHLEQHDWAGSLHQRQRGALRGHERVDDADALRCGDVQSQLIIHLLHGLPGHPSGELLRARGTGAYAVFHWLLAGPVRSG